MMGNNNNLYGRSISANKAITDKRGNTIKITDSSKAYDYLMTHCYSPQEMWREKVFVVFLDKAKQVLGQMLVSIGGYDSSVIDNRLVLKGAVDHGADGIILSHNHPSGIARPSGCDIEKTDTLRKACQLIGMDLVDHVIITNKTFFSFADSVEKRVGPKKLRTLLADNNPFCVPMLDQMYDAVRDYIRAFQGDQGFILTDDDDNDTIFSFLYDESINQFVEKQVKAVRVTPEGAVEAVFDSSSEIYDSGKIKDLNPKCWKNIHDCDVKYLTTIFSLAEKISEYTQKKMVDKKIEERIAS